LKKKLVVIQFMHETNVFCPKPADEKAFRDFHFHTGEEVFKKYRGKGNELGAFFDVLMERKDIELIPTVALHACPCGIVMSDVYDFVVRNVTEVICKNSPLDGVIIAFHGAMVAEGHHDGEGDLLEIIRELVGQKIPVIASLDLHANVTPKMARCATAMVPFEHYPHIDTYDTGYVVAKLMEETLDGKLNPVMAYRRIPFLLPLFPSDFPEIQTLYGVAKNLQDTTGARCVRFTHGFFPADIEEMGMAVMAITDGDRELAEKLADELVNVIEDNIPKLKREYPSLEEALDIAIQPGDGPVVLADASDNPGAGGLGDTTHILRRILERGITGAAVATILDPVSAEACAKAGVGATVKLNLGGWSDPVYSGGPLSVTAYVRMITDGKYEFKGQMMRGDEVNHGKTAVVEISGNTVLITSLPRQPLDLEIFRSHGIAPEEQKILVTKSAIHYRASYGTVAREMIAVALPGYSSPVPQAYEYKQWKDKN